MFFRQTRVFLVEALFLSLLAACGGGGGGGGAPTGDSSASPPSLVLKADPSSATPGIDLSSSSASVKLSKVSDTEFQANLSNSNGAKVSMWLDTSSGTAVVQDAEDGTLLVTTRTPDVTTAIVYANDGSFVSGALKYRSDGQSYVAPMNSETDTDPRDHAADSVTLAAAVSLSRLYTVGAAASGHSHLASPLVAASTSSCYDFISGLTSDPASYADDAADALDQAGGSKRVSKVAKLLSTIWSKAASLCPDAPESPTGLSNEAAFVVAVYDQALDGNWNETVDTVSSLQQLMQRIEDGVAKAKAAIADGGTTISEAEQTLDPVGLTGTTADATAQADVAKIYFAQPACLTNGVSIPVVAYDSDGYTASFKYRTQFTNGCAYTVQLAFCTKTASYPPPLGRCTPYYRDEVAPGQTWSNLGSELQVDLFSDLLYESYTITVCPLSQDGHDAWLDSSKVGSACYYYQ